MSIISSTFQHIPENNNPENYCFAACMSLIFCEEMKENHQLTGRLEKTAAWCGMKVISNKSKIHVNSLEPTPSTNMWMNGQVLEEVSQVK